jgi:hypothetical protein
MLVIKTFTFTVLAICWSLKLSLSLSAMLVIKTFTFTRYNSIVDNTDCTEQLQAAVRCLLNNLNV